MRLSRTSQLVLRRTTTSSRYSETFLAAAFTQRDFKTHPVRNTRNDCAIPRVHTFGRTFHRKMPYMTGAGQPPKLTLTTEEQNLRRLLLDVAEHVRVVDGKPKASQIRFAGGWVRDKLLGVGSHDIDVAIDDATGEQFGARMKDYLEAPGNPEKYDLKGVDSTDGSTNSGVDKDRILRGLHKIEANPEKSKNLETVATRVFGLDVDLVNLRKEVYNEETRNPEMQFADTPEEDAFRRDATINAMFYNLQTEHVEDLTGRGLDDMRDKILRTPIEPFQTFKDDPLRILRLVRFASRLDYTIDDAAKQAMKDTTIKDALRKKISRERVGIEVEKMLRGKLIWLGYLTRWSFQMTSFVITITTDDAKSAADLSRT